ncbi:MAG: glycosyltransferase, partial [Desulfurococcaceae archaeon]
IKVLYNPLPKLPRFEKKLEELPTFLYCGGDSYIKGFYILLKALQILGKRKQTHFKIILTNKYSQESLDILNKFKKHYNLNIEVHGIIKYCDLVKLHSRSWALIFPSIWEEPLPYTVMEALLTGTLPVASKVGGVPEIVEKTHAKDFLLTSGEPEQLAEAIDNIADYRKNYLESNFTYVLPKEFREKYNIMFNEKVLLEIFYGLI